MNLEESYENLVNNHSRLDNETISNLIRLASFLTWTKTDRAYTTEFNGFHLKIENDAITSDDGKINIRNENIANLYNSLGVYCL